MKQLRELRLASSLITADGLSVLPNIPSLTTLTVIAERVDGDEACEYIGQCTKLQELSVHVPPTSLTDKGMRRLCGATELRSLDLSRSSINTDLDAIKRMTKLERLDVSGSKVGDLALQSLKGHPTLKRLDVSNCGTITDVGGEVLGTIDSLEMCSLDGAAITGQSIAGLHRLKHLENLSIEKIAIDAQFAKAMEGLTQVDRIYLGGAQYMKVSAIELRRVAG